MKHPFNKKRFWLVVGVVAVLEVLVLYLVLQWKYLFPSSEVSELYTKYANTEGVEASFVKDFRINDTVFVDVTMLEAEDSVAWALLCKDFEVPILSLKSQRLIQSGVDLICSGTIPKSESEVSTNTYMYNVLAISYLSHTLTVFHTINEDEKHAVQYYNFDKSIYQ